MASGSNRQWSSDAEFVQDFTTLKRWFMDAIITENPYAAHKALKLLLSLCRPKLRKYKPDEVSTRLKWVEDNLNTIQYFTDGRAVETDGTRHNKKAILTYLEITFDLILDKTQLAGIYTRNAQDVKEAMGDFSDS